MLVINKKLLMNTALLSFCTIIMRCISMAFQVWLVSRIGATGIGLFQLVMSVEMLCVTFAVSGIRFAVTRLVSEELGSGRSANVDAAMKRCFAYCLVFGLTAFLFLYKLAEPIGFLWIGDARTVKCLQVLACGLPFISLSSAVSGYFVACGRIWKSALVHLTEQFTYIALVAYFLSLCPYGDIELSCLAVTSGITIADVVSFLLMFAVYLDDRRKYKTYGRQNTPLTRRMLGIALPLASSAYARSALSTLQQLLVPRGLKLSGMTADTALTNYGIITGMVLPIIIFPSCILSALAELIVPMLTEMQMKKDDTGISHIVSSLIKKSMFFSVTAALIIFILADKLGMAIYKSTEAVYYIRLLAPLIPIVYVDMVADGCLKGLGQHVWSMAINIVDALIAVVLVYTLLPRYGLSAYIAITYFNEILNFILSMLRLKKFADIRLF